MASSSDSPPEFSRFDLPGFTLPLNFCPMSPSRAKVAAYSGTKPDMSDDKKRNLGEGKDLFPSALAPNVMGSGLSLTTLRELTMIQMMNAISDKPNWENKIHNSHIVAKWEAEFHATSESGVRDITSDMFNWVVQELRYKAQCFGDIGAISLYNGDVVKSDSKVPEPLREALRSAVVPLENIPEIHRDYHPGSDNKVVDLVHPSLFPFIYGRSRILPDKLVGLDNCIEMIGLGKIIPVPADSERRHIATPRYFPADLPFSKHFQWLPCDVEISAPNNQVKITSYINNLHPQKHQLLYAIIEEMISHAIPLWNLTLTPLKDAAFRWKRISYDRPHYDPDPETMPNDQKPQQEPGESEDQFETRLWEWEATFRSEHVVQPRPGNFQPPKKTVLENAAESVDLRRDYGHRGLQVIVKLASICLTPDKPTYDGGSWHVEGQMNEHVCATALYYYDSENITESRLSFRQQIGEDDTIDIAYEQGDWVWSMPVFGLENEQSGVQNVGDIVCKEGRLVTFPNVLQHRVLPFELEDHSKPGHRKILALFLIDPNIRVISTANVPPQQREWWSEHLTSGGCFPQLAHELQDKIFEGVDDFPIGFDEAKKVRLDLMDERRDFTLLQNDDFESVAFSLCEH